MQSCSRIGLRDNEPGLGLLFDRDGEKLMGIVISSHGLSCKLVKNTKNHGKQI